MKMTRKTFFKVLPGLLGLGAILPALKAEPEPEDDFPWEKAVNCDAWERFYPPEKRWLHVEMDGKGGFRVIEHPRKEETA